MVNKIAHIITGWAKILGIVPTSTAEQKLAELRLKICAGCLFHKVSKILTLINGEGKFEDTLICGICHCPCHAKCLVVDEKCPKRFW